MYDLNYDEMTKEELIQYIKECKKNVHLLMKIK